MLNKDSGWRPALPNILLRDFVVTGRDVEEYPTGLLSLQKAPLTEGSQALATRRRSKVSKAAKNDAVLRVLYVLLPGSIVRNDTQQRGADTGPDECARSLVAQPG